MTLRSMRTLASMFALLAACDAPAPALDAGSDAGPSGPAPGDCDPLDPTACALPWPSSLYLVPDEGSATGVRISFGEGSLPAGRGGPLRPELFEGLDGYGLGVPVIAGLGELDHDPLPGEWDGIERSLDSGSPSLLFRVTDTGALERVPHFVEPDRHAIGDGETRVVFLRPAVVLEPATRYVVAFRGLRRPDGTPVAASPAFAALRDGEITDDPDLEARRERFEEMLTALEGAGVARSELVLAWDFVTASLEALHGPLDRAIELALADAPEGGSLEILETERFAATDDGSGDPTNENLRYGLDARLTRPTVVERGTGGQGWQLVRDAGGEVALAGSRLSTRLRIQVPHRAVSGESVGVLVYGHGLLGNQLEVEAGHLQRIAEAGGLVVIGVPMVGMSADDLPAVILALRDLNRFGVISDGLVQGILDHHLVVRFARTALQAALREIDPTITIDPDRVHYFGGSQGGIFGQTILATSPELTRAVLAVPGSNYITLLDRSSNFPDFEDLLDDAYRTRTDRVIALTAAQLLWDRTDPVSYLGRMLGRHRDDGRDRRALFLVSKGDYQVAVVTNEIAMRTFPEELRMMAGYDERTPAGLVATPYPHEGSGVVLFDFGNPWPEDRGNLPPDDGLGDPHSRIAEVDEAWGLLDTFLREGRIVDVCDGDGCNPR